LGPTPRAYTSTVQVADTPTTSDARLRDRVTATFALTVS
jgi:hypothetical protein